MLGTTEFIYEFYIPNTGKWDKLPLQQMIALYPEEIKEYINEKSTLSLTNNDADFLFDNSELTFSGFETDSEFSTESESDEVSEIEEETKIGKDSKIMNFKSVNKNMNEKQEKDTLNNFMIIDSGSDTGAIGGTAWLIDEVTQREVDVIGFYDDATLRNIKIGTGITAIDLPNKITILLMMNEATLLGEHGSSLISTFQARSNGVTIQDIPKTHGEIPYIKVDDYLIPLTMKNGLLGIDIQRPTETEIMTCDVVVLTSDDPRHPEMMEEQSVDLEEYLSICS